MRFLLDENAELRLARYLRDSGHDVTAVVRDYPAALPEEEVLAIALREGRILITNDRDFERLILQQHRPHCGVILFRLPQGQFSLKVERLARVLNTHGDELVQFLIVTEHEVIVQKPVE